MDDKTRKRLKALGLDPANLTGAVLIEANLRLADLTEAVLIGANLTGAVLTGAVLTEAVLTRAIGPFTTGQFGRHTAVAAGSYIAIGCERHDYDWWLANYEAVGLANGYSVYEIADYGAWIRQAVARQRRIEGTVANSAAALSEE